MQRPLIPSNEEQRLRALHNTHLLDTPSEERFDRLTRLARQLFDVPIALISLVDAERQWFKSREGLGACETDRSISFCGHTILGSDIFEITNAARDARFSDNPLVKGDPHIRFYAGAPLMVDGYGVGTLCIIDTRPRQLDNDQRRALRDLADVVESELKKVDQVRQSEELARLSRVASQTTNGVIITDMEGRVEWINEGFTRITGYSLEDLQGRKPGHSLQGQDTDPTVIAQMRQALRQHQGFEVDLINYTKDGRPYWIHIHCSPLFDSAGVAYGFMAIESDITAQKQAEIALQNSETRLRGLFELSPLGISLNDYETGVFLDLNQALLEPTGYTLEEIRTLSYWDLTPLEYEDQEVRQLERLKEYGHYGQYEKEFIRKDGSRFPVLLNGMVVCDQSGRKLIWSIVEDISERKRIEQMKNDFIATVSHELRTPVTSINGALSLVVGGVTGEIPASMHDMLSIAHKNSERLGLLVNDLLDMEKLTAGKVAFDLRIQPLYPLLKQAVQTNQSYADRFGVKLNLIADNAMVEVWVDSARIQQVLANLLSNAAKFSPEGGNVTIKITTCEHRVRISVTDHGVGIPQAYQDRIFQKFSQVDTSDSRQKGGSGLGLAITRELVERMGGTVGFESIPDRETTFWFALSTVPPEVAP